MHSTQPMTKDNRNAMRLDRVVQKFNTMDITAIMSCFCDDVITRYNGAPAIIGKANLCDFLSHRYADITDYSLTKSLRLSQDDTIAVEACAKYTKKSTGEHVMVTIQELLEFDGDLIRKWDYVGHVTQASDPLQVVSAMMKTSIDGKFDNPTSGT